MNFLPLSDFHVSVTRHNPVVDLLRLDHVPDIRLIACDMDGTLLDDQFWPLFDQLQERGIVFCPASGRQYYSLLEQFKPIADEVIFVAENGTYVVRGGIELSCRSSQQAKGGDATKEHSHE